MSESQINLTEDEKKQLRLKKIGSIGQTVGAISGIANSILPSRSEYQGEYGGLSQSLDTGYDAIADGAASFGPYGQMVSGIMKAGAAVNKLTGLVGGGTDGMCVCAGTKVFKANGEIINIEKLQKDDGIIGWNTHKTIPQLIHDFVEPRYKQCVEIVLKNGSSLRCSVDHPILNLTSNIWEFKRADKLKIGDTVGLAPNINYWGSVDNNNSYTIGYSLKDEFYNEKSIKDIRKFNKISTCKFLAGLFDSSGSIDSENSIILYRSNANLLKEISLHLQKLGIFSIFKTLSKHKHILKIQDSISTFYKEIPVRKFSCNLPELENNILSEPIRCEIESITHIGTQIVYNLQADYDNTYLANGIITHNTKTDSILGSSFLGLTPIGLINGFGGKRAKKFGIDQDTLSSTNGSYDALLGNAQSAASVSGKKFGLFSSGERHRANRLIDTTNIQQDRVRNIIQEGSISQNLINSMSAINANKYALQLQGGYDPDNMRIGRHGMSLELLHKARKIIKAQKGTKVKDNKVRQEKLTYNSPEILTYIRERFPILNDIDLNILNDPSFTPNENADEGRGNYGDLEYVTSQSNTLPYYKINGVEYVKPDIVKGKSVTIYNNNLGNKANEWIALDALTHGLRDQDTYYQQNILPQLNKAFASSIDNGLAWWVKNHNGQKPDKEQELEIANSYLDGILRDLLVKDGYRESYHPTYKSAASEYLQTPEQKQAYQTFLDYISKKKQKATRENISEFKQGGSIIELTNPLDLPEFQNGGSIKELITESIIELVDPFTLPEFQNGGSINVIPSGALHARRHNMNLEGITEKGIPVVSEKEDGKIEQQAEIEKEEVIFRLEVTQKLEKLQKKYYNEESSQKEKDEYALEAGKLIVNELLHNTKDNVGIL